MAGKILVLGGGGILCTSEWLKSLAQVHAHQVVQPGTALQAVQILYTGCQTQQASCGHAQAHNGT